MEPYTHVISQQAIEENRTLKSGYVEKRFRARNQWKTRWLVLRNHVLSIYKDDKEYELQNSIDLFRTSKIEEYNKKKRENVFIIGTPKKKYYFQCYDSEDRKDWIKTLLQARESMPLSEPNIIAILNEKKEHKKSGSDSDGSWASKHLSAGSFSSNPSHSTPFPHEALDLTSDYSDLEGDNNLDQSYYSPTTPVGVSSSPPMNSLGLDLSAMPSSTDNSIYMQGILYKHCEGYRAWRKRWFVLRADNLCYYKDEREYELLAMIPLKDISEVTLATTTSKSRAHCFKFKTSKRTYKLASKDESERDKWITAINEKIAS
ncbi:PH-domain-containing protein [Neoconidiobolus thromboides FSU 785]|nr:PH-domain-containing protein [Neoconidiobolus thromboides FSU 785]